LIKYINDIGGWRHLEKVVIYFEEDGGEQMLDTTAYYIYAVDVSVVNVL
jgi:hypothetical protein